ncbi:MAG: hypothetical protein GY835_28260 [bacterium]|nr:hypothetical protein [bacterium]
MPKRRICYYCGRPATSKEHVPPRCLFPEEKDTGGVDFRVNLFTVPACDRHNSEKARDDEFLLANLAPIVGNNKLALHHTYTKLARAIEHTGGELQSIAVKEPRAFFAVDEDGKTYPVIGGKPDMPRLTDCFNKIARGIYFLEKGEPFDGECKFIPGYISFFHQVEESDKAEREGPRDVELSKTVGRSMLKRELEEIPVRGSNPEVFTYQFGNVDQFGLIPLLMTFYESAEVMGAYQPSGIALPFRSLDDLFKQAKVTITLELKERDD